MLLHILRLTLSLEVNYPMNVMCTCKHAPYPYTFTKNPAMLFCIIFFENKILIYQKSVHKHASI